MDRIDREILGVLQRDGRITATDLAKRVRLSLSGDERTPAAAADSGVVRRFTAVIDAASVGRPIEALVDVRVAPAADQPHIDRALAAMAAVTDAVHLTGRFDMQLRISSQTLRNSISFWWNLRTWASKKRNTRLVLRSLDGFPRAPEPVL